MSALRSRFPHSLLTLGRLMGIWGVLVGTVFWMEPVLIYQVVMKQNLGLGDVTWSVYLKGILVWLVPLTVLEVVGLWWDIKYAAARLKPGEYHNAYNPKAPAWRSGPLSYASFKAGWFSSYAIQATALFSWAATAFAASLIICVEVVDAMAQNRGFDAAGAISAMMAASMLVYGVASAVVYLNFAEKQSDNSKSSTLFLPWQQKWTWVFLLVTLPFAAYYIVAYIRLVWSRKAGTSVRMVTREVFSWPAGASV